MERNNQGLRLGSLLRNGTYRIERVLGQGGFGITYMATDLSLDRRVAIKEFFPKSYCDRDSSTSHVTLGTQSAREFVTRLKAKFLKEARNIARFDHPGIIRIHAAFEENNTAYYVMDYIEGCSLAEWVKSHGPLDEATAIKCVLKAGNALEYVHNLKFNHLDIKPANRMLRPDFEPVLIDFGLSKAYDSDGQQTSSTPVGLTHGFAPMEQYKDGGVKVFSPQTDIYSLAATLYYLLSGVVPPDANTILEEGLSFPGVISQKLIPPIAKAMSLRRPDRHASVTAFLHDLTTASGYSHEERTQFVEPPRVTSSPMSPVIKKSQPKHPSVVPLSARTNKHTLLEIVIILGMLLFYGVLLALTS